MAEFLQNTRNDYFSIIDPLAFEKFSDLKNVVLFDSIKGTISSTIADVLSKGINGIDLFGTGIGPIVSSISSFILEQNNISQDSFAFYKFRVNPQKMSVSRKKIMDKKYTGAGWDLDTMNEEMITFNYEGTTGSLVPYNLFSKTVEPELRSLLNEWGLNGIIGQTYNNYFEIPILSRNPKLSASYIKFLNFEQFWKYNNNDLLFIWEDNCYVGKFVDFSYTITEKEPYQIMWRFNIEVYPDFKYNLYTGWIDDKAYDVIQQTFNKRYKQTKLFTGSDPLDLNSVTSVIKGFEDKLTFEEADALEWFESLGDIIYGKNKVLLDENRTRDKGIDLSKINPIQLAELYKQNSNIDLFEDSIEFNLKNFLKEETKSVVTGKSGGFSSLETQIQSNINQVLPS